MADIAQLGYDVNTAELKAAEREVDRLTSSTLQADRATKALGASSGVAGRSLRGAGQGAQGFGAALPTRNIQAMRGQLQQAGFQLQDIAVQFQAGTRASIVFGQQLPQLLGAFGAGGALAGVAITGLTVAFAPLIDRMFSAQSASDELDTRVENLSDAMSLLAEANERAAATYPELVAEYGQFAAAVSGVFADLAGSRAQNAQSRLDELVETISSFAATSSPINGLTTNLSRFFDIVPDAFVMTRAARDSREELRDFIVDLETAQSRLNDLEGDPQAQVIALQEFLALASQAADRSGERSEQEREFLQLIEQQIVVAARLSSVEENSLDIAVATRQALSETAQARAEDADAAAAILADLQQQQATQQAIAQFGADSAEVARLASNAERETLSVRLQSLSITEEMRAEILSAFDATVSLAEAAAGVSFSSALSETAQLAENIGISLAAAQALSSALNPTTFGDRTNGVGGFETGDPRSGTGPIFSGETNRVTRFQFGGSGVSGASGGGGGSSVADQYEENLNRLVESLATERETIEIWNAESEQLLNDARAREFLSEEEHRESLLRLEQEYQSRLSSIRDGSQSQMLTESADFFGSLASIAEAGGAQTTRAVATFSAIQATINSYVAATEALRTPGIGLAGRFAAYASVLATGLQGVAAIKQAGSTVGGGGSGAASSGVSASTEVAQEPERRVTIDFSETDPFIQSLMEPIIEQIFEETSNGAIITVRN